MSERSRYRELVADAKENIAEISPTDAAIEIESSGAVMVDVREKDEWDEEHIPAAIHLRRGTIELDIEEKVPDPNTTVILHCGAAAAPRSRPKVCKRWATKTSAR